MSCCPDFWAFYNEKQLTQAGARIPDQIAFEEGTCAGFGCGFLTNFDQAFEQIADSSGVRNGYFYSHSISFFLRRWRCSNKSL
jgi:hypothetical protein